MHTFWFGCSLGIDGGGVCRHLGEQRKAGRVDVRKTWSGLAYWSDESEEENLFRVCDCDCFTSRTEGPYYCLVLAQVFIERYFIVIIIFIPMSLLPYLCRPSSRRSVAVEKLRYRNPACACISFLLLNHHPLTHYQLALQEQLLVDAQDHKVYRAACPCHTPESLHVPASRLASLLSPFQCLAPPTSTLTRNSNQSRPTFAATRYDASIARTGKARSGLFIARRIISCDVPPTLLGGLWVTAKTYRLPIATPRRGIAPR